MTYLLLRRVKQTVPISERTLVARFLVKKVISGFQVAIGSSPFVNFPVPPYDLMRRTAGKTLWQYYHGGLRSYLPIAVLAEHEGVQLRGSTKILDFGCGVGRQLLHFCRDYPCPTYFACDVHPQSVEFIRRAYPQVVAYTSGFGPPLDYEDKHFDMVYSVSVFSHLHPNDHGPWLKELSRIVRPGGYAFLTIEGATAMRRRMATRVWRENPDDALAVLERDGIRYAEYDDLAWHKAHEGDRFAGAKYAGVAGSYGNTVMTPAYVRRHWSGVGFEVKSIVEGVIDRRQDVVVLRRL
jgi:SAM-dependent methyltransferase